MRFRLRVVPSTVTGIKSIPRIHKESHPGQITLKLEEVNIHVIHRLNADANELLGQFGDFGILTDNLPVEARACQSPLATEDNKERLAVLARQLLSLGIVVDPWNFAVHGLGYDFCCPWSASQREDESTRQCFTPKLKARCSRHKLARIAVSSPGQHVSRLDLTATMNTSSEEPNWERCQGGHRFKWYVCLWHGDTLLVSLRVRFKLSQFQFH